MRDDYMDDENYTEEFHIGHRILVYALIIVVAPVLVTYVIIAKAIDLYKHATDV